MCLHTGRSIRLGRSAGIADALSFIAAAMSLGRVSVLAVWMRMMLQSVSTVAVTVVLITLVNIAVRIIPFPVATALGISTKLIFTGATSMRMMRVISSTIILIAHGQTPFG